MAESTEDPFTTLLTLEDALYTTAYTHGTLAGSRSGRIEGRIFGLEKGFEKFSAMGTLHGRACVWGSRLPKAALSDSAPAPEATRGKIHENEHAKTYLKELNPTARTSKTISTLHALTDPYTFSTQNTSDAVADFDDRFKRAEAKYRIVNHTLKENVEETPNVSNNNTSQNGNGSSEVGGEWDRDRDLEVDVAQRERRDVKGGVKSPKRSANKNPKRVTGVGWGKSRGAGPGKGDDGMEDFKGSRLVR